MISFYQNKHRKSLGPIGLKPSRTRRHHNPAEMADALARERDRADRTNLTFAMVVFTFGRTREDRDAVVVLLEVLSKRLRLADEFGRLDTRRVAVILPATDGAGAWTVADDACLAMPDDRPLPECEVFVYHTDASSASRMGPVVPAADRRTVSPVDSATQRSDADSDPGGDSRVEAVDSPAASPIEESEPAAVASDGDGDIAMVTARRSMPGRERPIDRLFARPIPWWKRTIDFALSAMALLVLSPLFAVVALAIKLTSTGPVFYAQWRSGLGGRRFRMYKFRSMVVDADRLKAQLMAQNEQDGPAFKIRNDPRVTTIGRIIRRLSIDELPQFWNVLIGDMSLVGPRPLPCDESDQCLAWQRRRLDVTPGLTCVWQVSGRSQVTFDEWARMDLGYVRTQSLLRDMGLIARTVPVVLSGRGAS